MSGGPHILRLFFHIFGCEGHVDEHDKGSSDANRTQGQGRVTSWWNDTFAMLINHDAATGDEHDGSKKESHQFLKS